jgi:hypothetical protein
VKGGGVVYSVSGQDAASHSSGHGYKLSDFILENFLSTLATAGFSRTTVARA